MKPVAQCTMCKKAISSAEIEVGMSLVCEICAPEKGKVIKPAAEHAAAEESSKKNEE